MPTGYTYGVWDGKSIIGTSSFLFPLMGRTVVFPPIALLKEAYSGKKCPTIEVPIHYLVEDDGVTIKQVRVLDVRRKSKRQKAVICGQTEKT